MRSYKHLLCLLSLVLIFINLLAVYSLEDNILTTKDTTQYDSRLDSLTQKLYTNTDDRPLPELKTPSFSGMMMRMLISLFVLIIILYFALKFIKKLNQGSGSILSNSSSKVLQVINLDLKHRVFTVLIHQNIYIIAVSAEKTELLEIINDQEKISQIIASISEQKDLPSFSSFVKLFKNKK